jgi:hypothetical protein
VPDNRTSPARRKSPLGYDEYVVPRELYGDYGLGSALGKSYQGGQSYYREEADTPEVNTHERIHIGQYQLPAYPDAKSVKMALSPSSELLSTTDPYEMPAYLFSSALADRADYATGYPKAIADRQQESFNNYIELVRRTNPDHVAHVEAAMPARLQREYINTPGARHPLPPRLEVKEHGLLETLRGALRNK